MQAHEKQDNLIKPNRVGRVAHWPKQCERNEAQQQGSVPKKHPLYAIHLNGTPIQVAHRHLIHNCRHRSFPLGNAHHVSALCHRGYHCLGHIL